MRLARSIRSVACAGCACCLAACGSLPATGASVLPASARASGGPGTLTGVVRMFGGPLDPSTGRQALNGRPASRWRVTVRSGTRVVAQVTSDPTGRFTVRLPQGSYQLDCLGPRSVVVIVGQTTTGDCAVAVP